MKIQELKEKDFKDLFKEEVQKEANFVREVQIDTDIEMLIPDEYIQNIQERLSLYTELDGIETEEGLQAFIDKMKDRFGRIPRAVRELFDGLRVRWISKRLGFERVILKRQKLRCYFVENPQSPFYESSIFNNLMAFVASRGHEMGLSFKKSPRHIILVKDGVKNLKETEALLKQIEEAAQLVQNT